MYNRFKYKFDLMNQRPSCHLQTALLLSGLASACLPGCSTEPAKVQAYKEPTWASSVSATTSKHPGTPTGLRCTVLPQAQLDAGELTRTAQESSRIAELRATKGRDIPVVALATLPHLADGSVTNGYTILPSAGSPDEPMFIGLTLGAKNFRKNGRFIQFDLTVEYSALDREVPFKVEDGNVIRLPLRSATEVHTAVTLAPDQAMAYGIPGKDYILLIEFTYE